MPARDQRVRPVESATVIGLGHCAVPRQMACERMNLSLAQRRYLAWVAPGLLAAALLWLIAPVLAPLRELYLNSRLYYG
jgi:hypothetical protein